MSEPFKIERTPSRTTAWSSATSKLIFMKPQFLPQVLESRLLLPEPLPPPISRTAIESNNLRKIVTGCKCSVTILEWRQSPYTMLLRGIRPHACMRAR